jgi:protein-S-isoprenylcysteine O-methyltransferase Ste14
MQLVRGSFPRFRSLLPAAAKLLAAAGLCLFVVRALQAYQNSHQLNLLLLVIAESLTIVLVLVARSPEKVVVNLKTCALTAGATFYFLVVDLVGGVALVPSLVSQTLQCLAIAWQIIAKLYLGNRFGLLPANRGIVDSGPFRLVRHPVYFGYLIGHVGYLLSALSVRNVLVYALLYIFQIARLLEEEKVLSRSASYQVYRKRVRYRLVPGVF